MKRVVCDKGCVFCNDDGTDCIALKTARARYTGVDYIEVNCGKCKFYKSKEEYKKTIIRSCDQGTSWVVEKRKT